MSTKDRIIESSFPLFLKKGWDNVSLTDVKKAANITSGGFYHYFSSKEELITEIERKYIIRYFEQVIVRISQIKGTFKEKLEAIMPIILGFDDDTVKNADRPEDFYKDFYALYVESVRRNTNEDHILAQFHTDLLEYNKRMVKKAKANGEIPENIDEYDFALFLLAHFKGIIALWLVMRNHLDLKEFVDKNINTILTLVEH